MVKEQSQVLESVNIFTNEAVNDADYNISYPYRIEQDKLFKREETDISGKKLTSDVAIGSFWAVITEVLTNEDGSESYVLSGKSIYGGEFTIEIDSEDFEDSTKLSAKLGAAIGPKDSISHRSQLNSAIKYVTRAFNPAYVKQYNRTGWAKGQFLIPGRVLDGIKVNLPPNLHYKVNADADLDSGLQALDYLLQSTPANNGPVLLSFVLGAPLAKLAGWHNNRYQLFVAGTTGSKKTSHAKLFMALYGREWQDEERFLKWGIGATKNAMIAVCESSADMPVLIDNFKPNTSKNAVQDFVEFSSAVIEGEGKRRLNRNGEMRHASEIHAWPLITGEDTPQVDTSVLARSLVARFDCGKEWTPDMLTNAQELSEHLNAVGLSWIEWLEANPDLFANSRRVMMQRQTYWRNYILNLSSDSQNIDRIAMNLAINEYTYELICQHPTIGPVASKFKDQHKAALEAIAKQMCQHTKVSFEADRYVTMLRELLASNRATLQTKRDQDLSNSPGQVCIGWKDGNGGAYVLPAIALELIRPYDNLNGLSQETINKQLVQLDYVEPGKDGKTAKQVRLGKDKRNQRVLHLLPKALDVPVDQASESL